MENFINILKDASSPEELESFKVQLFRENVRLRADQTELEEMYEQLKIEKKHIQEIRLQLEKDRKQLDTETAQLRTELQNERRRLQEDNLFLEKKQTILESSLRQLDFDRKKLERERSFLETEKQNFQVQKRFRPMESQSTIFFRGIATQSSLKKRYKELLKVFHPDNACGDSDTLMQINREYEELKQLI